MPHSSHASLRTRKGFAYDASMPSSRKSLKPSQSAVQDDWQALPPKAPEAPSVPPALKTTNALKTPRIQAPKTPRSLKQITSKDFELSFNGASYLVSICNNELSSVNHVELERKLIKLLRLASAQEPVKHLSLRFNGQSELNGKAWSCKFVKSFNSLMQWFMDSFPSFSSLYINNR